MLTGSRDERSPLEDDLSDEESSETGLSEATGNAEATLDDAVDWFNSQLDREIPDHTEDGEHPQRPTTAREWFVDTRGYEPGTVRENRLGWAPAGATSQLVQYLLSQGHDRDAIRGTGLFTEDLRLLWNGRYVFPYLGLDGRAQYAIGRATGSLGGGDAGYDGHPDDFIAGKYAKLAHTKNYVHVSEPIYGLASLDRDTPIVITEGVADAVRAHEAGYACLSPVTTQFKQEHREQLVDILDGRDRRVYIVQDAERPKVECNDKTDGWEALGVEQYGEGVKGAARTAAFLTDAGVDAYLAELPRLGLDKVDLDDYLGEWGDDLRAVLASAKPGHEHPAYEPTTVSRNTDDDGGIHDPDRTGPTERGGNGADLDAEDVREALDHISKTLSYDEWIQLAYSVHAWDDGDRGERIFTGWSRKSPKWDGTESQNVIDWVWENAATGTKVTVATLIARAIDGGWEPPARDTDPVAALPLRRLDQLDAEEARRYASKHGVDWPTTRNARERLRSSIMETMRHGDTRLHDAPTALGKSYTVATEPWLRRADTTGEAPVIHLSETREARDQAADASRDADVSHARLLGRSEACPIAAGEHDPATDDEEDDPDDVITKDGVPASDWFDRVCEGRGLPFSVAHKYLAEHNDQGADLPCCEEGECRSIAQWDGLPRDEDGEPAVDVIHATHGFAHVPSLRNGTNLIFDERPSFVADLTHDRVRKAVTAYLSAASAPTSTYEQFVSRTLRGDDTPNEHGEHAFISQALEYVPDREWYLEADDAHTLAPALTRAIYKALLPDDEEGDAADANGRYAATVSHKPPRLDKDASDDSTWNRTYVSVVIDEDLTVRVVRNSPSMAGARSVVGLDAHPDVTLWQQNVHPDILIDPVLGPSERALWRRYERGLLTVGVGDATRPLTSGEYFDEDGSRAFFGALRDHFGDRFSTAITAASVESRTANLLEDVGVDDPETMHYGEEKSRDDFGDEDVGALNGCIDPGDDYVLDLLAEAGLDARPETTTSDDGDEHRAHGRGFVGPDADAAASLLASVREQHVAQAAGRYARNADDPEDRAIVFVRTIAAPAGFLDLTVPGVEWLPTDAQQEIVETLRNQRKATARELAEAVDVSKEHVRKTLRRLSDTGVVDVHEGAGDHGAHLYRALAGLGSGETVDLTPETTNDPVWSTYTWSLAIDEPVDVVKPTVGTSRDAPAAADGVDAGDPLGDPPS